MINEFLLMAFRTLCRVEIVASIAIVLVLLIRAPARQLLGSGLAYRLWALPLAAAAASLFPTLSEFRRGFSKFRVSPEGALDLNADILLSLWLAGAVLFLGVLISGERRFRRHVRQGTAGPAVTGIGWHTLVTPSDFRARFNGTERDFILRHERMHILRRDPEAGLLIALLQAVSWFNPLAHLAAASARLDQELACDEAVISNRPESRRGYAETLLKAQLSAPRSPFACAFNGGYWAATGRHPLEVRLSMIARPQPGLIRHLAGGVAVGAMGLLIAALVWAAAPEKPPGAAPAWEALSRIVNVATLSPSD
jgi:beta-lactamase regulating signal transducer with metallopeptidase domain